MLASCDAVVIVTNHSSHDYVSIVDSAKLAIDIPNATRCVMRHRAKIVLCQIAIVLSGLPCP